jgi:hypothetical protein
LQKYQEFKRLKNEGMCDNVEQPEWVESDVRAKVTGSRSPGSDGPGDSFAMIEMELKELSLREKERILDVDLNTRQIITPVFPDREEEEESDIEMHGSNWELWKFLRLFLTPQIYANSNSGKTQLTFPSDKERPWAYTDENGDMIIDCVSEILAEVDVDVVDYEVFLDRVVGQLGRKPMSTAPIIANLEKEFETLERSSEIQMSTAISDRILDLELGECLGC